jgi:hypothetical protein
MFLALDHINGSMAKGRANLASDKVATRSLPGSRSKPTRQVCVFFATTATAPRERTASARTQLRFPPVQLTAELEAEDALEVEDVWRSGDVARGASRILVAGGEY